jgi:hypothetical protein
MSGRRIDPSRRQHPASPLFVGRQYLVFASTDPCLQNLDTSHQAQLPSKLMGVESAFGVAAPLAKMPHAGKADRFAVPIGTLKNLHGEL